MRILELVVQGVPGSPGTLRLPLGAGTTVLHPGPIPLPLGRLLAFALYDESVEPPAELRAPEAETSRVGLTLQDPGGAVYRIVRDLKTGAVQLARYAADSKTFTPVSSRAAEACQYLRSQARVPGEDLFRDLLWIGAANLPSRYTPPLSEERGGVRRRLAAPVMGGAAAAARYEAEAAGGRGGPPSARFGGGGADTGFGAPALGGGGQDSGTGGWGGLAASGPAPDPFAHLSVDARKEKLADLEKRKAALDEADELQFALDGKQRALFENEQKRSRVTALEKEVAQLQAALAEFEGMPAVGDDLAKAIRGYAFQKDRLDKALARIDEERERLDEALGAPPAMPIHDPILKAGAGAVLAFTALAIFFEPVRWLLFLNPLALGVVAFSLLEWIGEQEAFSGLDAKRKALDARAEQAKRTFELDTVTVRGAMKQLRVEKVEDLEKRLEGRHQAESRHAEARARLEQTHASPEFSALSSEAETLAAEIADLESRLRASGAVGVSPADLMRDIEALRASVERAERGETAPATPDPPAALDAAENPVGAMGGGRFEPALGEGPRMPDPGPVFLARLADALQKSPETVGEEVRERLGQYLTALTGRRFTGLMFAGRGALMVVPAGGAALPWDAVPPPDRDTVWLALRLGLAEAFIRHAPQPLVLEAPFDAALDPGVWTLCGQMVRYLGGIGQALHLTPERSWADHADAAHDLGGGT
jgi:TolA-binding protein